MGLKGYTFDRMKISPKADALLYHSMLDGNDRIVKGYKDELKVVSTGLNTYVSPGACVIQGRMIEIDEEMQLSVSANDSGYVCVVIDLTQNNTSTGEAGTPDYQPINNQIRLEVVKELVQQDLHNGGQLYTFPLANFTSTGATVALTKINHNQRIVESGMVTNGWYTKFSDGTMILQMRRPEIDITDVPAGVVMTVNLANPIEFIGSPSVFFDGYFTNSAKDILHDISVVPLSASGTIDSNYMSFSIKNGSEKTIEKILGFEAIAIGRWK